MQEPPRIYLASDLPGAGKTTSTAAWAERQQREGRTVHGCVAPIIDCMRHMKLLSTSELHKIQLNEVTEQDMSEQKARRAALQEAKKNGTASSVSLTLESSAAEKFAESCEAACVVVGPYVFDAQVFGAAVAEVEEGLAAGAEWILLDEIGPVSARVFLLPKPPSAIILFLR